MAGALARSRPNVLLTLREQNDNARVFHRRRRSIIPRNVYILSAVLVYRTVSNVNDGAARCRAHITNAQNVG